jgi:hypothetical protein
MQTKPSAGGLKDIPLQVIPLFWLGQVTSNGHGSAASTPALVAVRGAGQGVHRDLAFALIRSQFFLEGVANSFVVRVQVGDCGKVY